MPVPSLRRLATAAGLAAALAAVPSVASAATVGSTQFGVQICGANTVWVATDYVLPAGVVTSFSYKTGTLGNGTAGKTLDFKVLRPQGNNGYTVVGSSGVKTLAHSDGTVDTFTPAAPIAAQAGDVLGYWIGNQNLPGCVGEYNPSSGTVAATGAPSDPAVGSTVNAAKFFDNLNLSAEVGPAVAAVTGNGSNNPKSGQVNQFSISSIDQTGNLNYDGANKTFSGAIQCVNIVGNSATIVARDYSTGIANRTMVQDNGVSGDKLVNTMFDPSKLSAKAREKFLSCVTPDLDRLAAGNALLGDYIQVSGSTSPAV